MSRTDLTIDASFDIDAPDTLAIAKSIIESTPLRIGNEQNWQRFQAIDGIQESFVRKEINEIAAWAALYQNVYDRDGYVSAATSRQIEQIVQILGRGRTSDQRFYDKARLGLIQSGWEYAAPYMQTCIDEEIELNEQSRNPTPEELARSFSFVAGLDPNMTIEELEDRLRSQPVLTVKNLFSRLQQCPACNLIMSVHNICPIRIEDVDDLDAPLQPRGYKVAMDLDTVVPIPPARKRSVLGLLGGIFTSTRP
jgi:hypothetical protein